MNTAKERIQLLRRWMKERNATACIVPQANPHLGEYVEPHWQLRAWWSGFTGSRGTLVVTAGEAALWTDSRYFLQAAEQLRGTGIEMMRDGLDASWREWLALRVADGGRVATDARLFSCADWQELARVLPMADDASFEALWVDRPPLEPSSAFVLPLRLTGVEAAEKLHCLREELGLWGGRRFLLSALDEIGWLLNLRGGDLPTSPLLRSFLLVDGDGGELFVDARSLDDRVLSYLEALHIKACAYDSFPARVQSFERGGLMADRRYTPAAVALWTELTQVKDPIPMWKAQKNSAELAALHQGMLQDGVVWVKFLRWFSESRRRGGYLRESDVVAQLRRLKSERPGYWGESFETIAAAGDHGAVVHYAVTESTDRVIGGKGLLLIDTGTQYEGATTDMTRTIACGPLTDEEKRDCTLVMRSHVALATAVFPQGMAGSALDGMARRPLWASGLDYGHGTGHGVGAMLNVHEDPVRVSWVSACPFKEGMVTSDEPGLYREGRHGVRLENMLAVVRDRQTEFGCFLKFNVLTLCPFDPSILMPELLTPEERDWLNGYHRRVKAALKPLLTPEEYDWLNNYAYEI